ncbi:MAG TPA: hypothetical protein VGN26_12015, partial [Armatimonadota bacterium]
MRASGIRLGFTLFCWLVLASGLEAQTFSAVETGGVGVDSQGFAGQSQSPGGFGSWHMWRSIGQSFGYVFFDLSTLTVPLGSVDEVTLTLTTAHLQGEDLMITIWTNPVSPDGSLLDHYAGYDFFTPGMQI